MKDDVYHRRGGRSSGVTSLDRRHAREGNDSVPRAGSQPPHDAVVERADGGAEESEREPAGGTAASNGEQLHHSRPKQGWQLPSGQLLHQNSVLGGR